MDKFRTRYVGHIKNARRIAVEIGLIKESELAYKTDDEITKLINNSDYIIIDNGEDWILIPKELENKLVWINR